jgi:hypothetical protein
MPREAGQACDTAASSDCLQRLVVAVLEEHGHLRPEPGRPSSPGQRRREVCASSAKSLCRLGPVGAVAGGIRRSSLCPLLKLLNMLMQRLRDITLATLATLADMPLSSEKIAQPSSGAPSCG